MSTQVNARPLTPLFLNLARIDRVAVNRPPRLVGLDCGPEWLWTGSLWSVARLAVKSRYVSMLCFMEVATR